MSKPQAAAEPSMEEILASIRKMISDDRPGPSPMPDQMGRTPFDNNLTTDKPGRDHNQYGLVVWMAGGGIKPGSTFGETDDFSVRSAGDEVPLRDVHATLLHLMGLNQNRLTYLHAGRYKKLTDIGGRVIQEVLA